MTGEPRNVPQGSPLHPHGTQARYRSGCRGRLCTAAHAAHQAQGVEARAARIVERKRQRDAEIVRRLDQGETIHAIRTDMHVTATTIRNAMRRLGVWRDLRTEPARYPHRNTPPRHPRGSGPTQRRVLLLLADGQPRTVREIADDLTLTVRRVAKLVTALYHAGNTDALITVAGRVHSVGARKFTLTEIGRTQINNDTKKAA